MKPVIAPPNVSLLSAAEIQEIVARALQKNFTGMGRVSCESGRELKLLIQFGQVSELIFNTGQGVECLPGVVWEKELASFKTAQFTLLPTPGRYLNFQRAQLSLPARESRESVFDTDLKKLLDKLETHEAASLVCLRAPDAEAWLLFSGGKLNLRRAVLVKADQISETPVAALIQNLAAQPCQLELYQGRLENEAWIALHLNLLFEFFCANLCQQYSYLTGKVMVNSILHNVLIYASQQAWDLSAANGRLLDQTLFPTLDEMKLAYQAILRLIEKQMHSFAGTNVVALMKNQTLDQLNTFYSDLWEHSGFDL